MLLAYLDETGINYKKNDQKNYFPDGPYAIWGAILVPESKYFHLERMFYDLISDKFKVTDWRKSELHATDIWNQAENGVRNIADVRGYFDELIQLVSKLRLSMTFGIQLKTYEHLSSLDEADERQKGMYSFLHALEHNLSALNETAIVIADKSEEAEDMGSLIYERTKWRYNPGDEKPAKIKPRYLFEYRSCFLLDQIHYADSGKSIFIQLSDHLNFILKRVFTFAYLKNAVKAKGIPEADLNKVPVSLGAFHFFLRNLFSGHYDKKTEDITMSDFNLILVDPNEFIPSGFIHELKNATM